MVFEISLNSYKDGRTPVWQVDSSYAQAQTEPRTGGKSYTGIRQ
jgi:hypothetical protein